MHARPDRTTNVRRAVAALAAVGAVTAAMASLLPAWNRHRGRRYRVLCHDSDDRLAGEANLVDGDQRMVGDGVAVDQLDVRQVLGRDDRDDTGMAARDGGVYRPNRACG